MKKSLFEKIIYDVPQWLITTLVYGIGGGILFLMLFAGCAPFEPIPGLCYTDKTGTYLCLEEETLKEECPGYDPDLDSSATNFCVEKKKYTAKEICSPYLGTDWWFECMNNES